jgi:membrane protein DedA with SNARE-associated domain
MLLPPFHNSGTIRNDHPGLPLDQILLQLQSLDPITVYAAVFLIALIENIFPPSPSDLMIVASGSLVGLGRVGFVETLACATLGSTIGFLIMYKIGDWFGVHILEQGKIKFIPVESVRKVEDWFKRYGYWIIVANRFLSGTRAVVSFFAGMSELKITKTTILCAASALAWNAILVTGGYFLGQNWQRIGFYLTTYSQIVTAILVIAVLLLVAKYIYNRRNGGKTA